jgi:hypothetical protein
LLLSLLLIRKVTFSDSSGSALALDISTSLTITGTATFLRNGDSAITGKNPGTLTLEDAEFVGNTAGGDGGAMSFVKVPSQ